MHRIIYLNTTFMLIVSILSKISNFDDTFVHNTLRILHCGIILVIIICKGLKSNRKPRSTLTDYKVLKIATLTLNGILIEIYNFIK